MARDEHQSHSAPNYTTHSTLFLRCSFRSRVTRSGKSETFLPMCKFRTRMWNRYQGSDVQTETVGNALEAECYSTASSVALISLFLISITSIYRAGDGDRTRDVQASKIQMTLIKRFISLFSPHATSGRSPSSTTTSPTSMWAFNKKSRQSNFS
jgi:hypothetical protein